MNIKKSIACMALMISTGYSSLMSVNEFKDNLNKTINSSYGFKDMGSQEPGLNESFEYYRVVEKFVATQFNRNQDLLSIAIAAGKFGTNTEFMWTLYNMASMGALRIEGGYEIPYKRKVSSEVPEEEISDSGESDNSSFKNVKTEVHVPSALETVISIVTNADKEEGEFFKATPDITQKIQNIATRGMEKKISNLLKREMISIDLGDFYNIINAVPQENDENECCEVEEAISKKSIYHILIEELENRLKNINKKDGIKEIEKLTEELEKREVDITCLQVSIQQKKAFFELTESIPEKYKEDIYKIISANKIKNCIIENTSKDFSEILKNLDLNDIELIDSESEYQTQFGLYGFTYSGKKLNEDNLSEALIVRLKEIIKDANYEQIEKVKSFEKFSDQLSEEIKQREGWLGLVNINTNSYDTSKFTEEEIKSFAGKISEKLREHTTVNILSLLRSFDSKEIGFLISRMQPLIDTGKFYYENASTMINNEGLFELAVKGHLSNLIKNAKTIETLNDITNNIPNDFIYKETIEKKENELKAALECPAEFKEVFEKVKKSNSNSKYNNDNNIAKELTYVELTKFENEALRNSIKKIYKDHASLYNKIDERIKFIKELPNEVDAKYKEVALQIADKFKGSNVKFDEVFGGLKNNTDAIILLATNPKYSEFLVSLGYAYKDNFNISVAKEIKKIIENADKDTLEYIEKNAIEGVRNIVDDSISIRRINFKTLKEVTDDLTKNTNNKFSVQYIERIKELVSDASEDEIKALYKSFEPKMKDKIPVELTKMNYCIEATNSLIQYGQLPKEQKSEMNKLLYNAKNAEEFLWSLSKDQLDYIAKDYDNGPGKDYSSSIGYVFDQNNLRMKNLYMVFGNYSNKKIQEANREELDDIKDKFLNDVFDKNKELAKVLENRNIELTQEETNSKLIELNKKYENTEYKDAAKIISEKLKDTIDHGMRDIVASISQTDEGKYLLGTEAAYLEILKKCNRKTKFDNHNDENSQNKDPKDLIKDAVSSYFKDLIKNADNKESFNDIVSKLIDPLKTALNKEIQNKGNKFAIEDNFKLATENPKEFFKEENDIKIATTLAKRAKEANDFDGLIKSCTTIEELLLLKKHDVYKKYYADQNSTTYEDHQLKEPFVEQIKNLVPTSSLEAVALITEQNFGKDIYGSLNKYIDARQFIKSGYEIKVYTVYDEDYSEDAKKTQEKKEQIRNIIKDELEKTNDTAKMMKELNKNFKSEKNKNMSEEVFDINHNNKFKNENLIKNLKVIDPELADKLPNDKKYNEAQKAIKNLK